MQLTSATCVSPEKDTDSGKGKHLSTMDEKKVDEKSETMEVDNVTLDISKVADKADQSCDINDESEDDIDQLLASIASTKDVSDADSLTNNSAGPIAEPNSDTSDNRLKASTAGAACQSASSPNKNLSELSAVVEASPATSESKVNVSAGCIVDQKPVENGEIQESIQNGGTTEMQLRTDDLMNGDVLDVSQVVTVTPATVHTSSSQQCPGQSISVLGKTSQSFTNRTEAIQSTSKSNQSASDATDTDQSFVNVSQLASETSTAIQLTGETSKNSQSINEANEDSQSAGTSGSNLSISDVTENSQSSHGSSESSQSGVQVLQSSQSLSDTCKPSQSNSNAVKTGQPTSVASTNTSNFSQSVSGATQTMVQLASSSSKSLLTAGARVDVATTQKIVEVKLKPQIIQNTALNKPKDARSQFNIKPPTSDLTSAAKQDAPSAQDIKDGHAYLRPMPKFLYQLGLSLLREVVYEGLADHVGGLRKKGDKKYSEEQFQSLQKSLTNLRKENRHLSIKANKKCPAVIDGRPCGFRTESDLVLETHLSSTHVNRSNRFVCARCGVSTPHLTTFRNHMLDKHALEAVAEKPISFFPCKLCTFENNNASRLQSHQIGCTKNFYIGNNLKPDSQACTPLNEGIFKPVPKPVTTLSLKPTTPVITKVQTKAQPMILPSKQPLHVSALRPYSGSGTLQQIKINSQVVHSVKPQTSVLAKPVASTGVAQIGSGQTSMDVLACEICGGFIQGLQALRVHMQWCHNINITHLKKAEFQCTNCLKCFWTVQGMAKHSTACKAASPAVTVPDTSTSCFICCKAYHSSQVEHLLAKHLSDLKHMVEIKKCLAPKCSPFLFGSVENLQFHLAKEHRLKMTGLAGLASANVSNIKFQPFCSICKLKFASSTEFAKHCAEKHVHKCDLCGAQCSTQQGLKEHEAVVHPYRFCLACDKQIKRSHYQIHLVSMHKSDKCRPVLKRISDEDYETYNKKPKLADWS